MLTECVSAIIIVKHIYCSFFLINYSNGQVSKSFRVEQMPVILQSFYDLCNKKIAQISYIYIITKTCNWIEYINMNENLAVT